MSELRFRVPGMTCNHCVSAVRSELEKLPGLAGVVIDLDTKAVVVDGEALNPAAVRTAVKAAGYEADL